MAICPFISSVNNNGETKLSKCFDNCALNIKGSCAFRILAKQTASNKHDTTVTPKK